MEIVQVNHLHRPSIGGLENYSHRLVTSLRNVGHDVSVITTDWSLSNDQSPLAVSEDVTYCGTTATLLRNPFSIELYREVKESTADIYHLHSPWYLSTLEAVYGLPKDVPKVMTIHGFQPMRSVSAQVLDKMYKPFAQYIFDNIDRTIVLGESEKERLVREFDISPANVSVIPNGIRPDEHDVPSTAVDQFHNRYDIDPTTPTVLLVSRLVPLKRPHILLEAVTSYLSDLDMDVIVIGEGEEDYQRKLEQYADDRFTFLSNLPFTELQAAYHSSDIFTMLSQSEGLPTVVLEAMNAQLPIITTPVGALADIVTHTDNGHVLNEDPSGRELARAVRHYVENPEEAAAIGKRNRIYVRTRFDWDQIAKEIEALYDEVLSSGKTRKRPEARRV